MTVGTAQAHEQLIRTLAAGLTPVRRLRSPALRAVLWLICVAAVGGLLLPFADVRAMFTRLSGAPDMWLAAFGSTATMVLAAIAVFELSLPDRSPRWAFLPLPAALVWLGASGAGCLRAWLVPGTHAPLPGEAKDCLAFILALSLPLSVLLLRMVRRACPLQPGLAAAIAGLASAAAAATLLNLFHPYDANATDVTVHVLAVAIVIAANRALGGRILQGHGA